MAHPLVVKQRDVKAGVTHDARHVQHQIAGTAGGVVNADGIDVVCASSSHTEYSGLLIRRNN
jgi:hypothetical protein